MQITETVAPHHELAHGTARLQHAKRMQEAALVRVDLMRKTALQRLTRVIEPLLRVTDAIQQLASQRARATVDPPLEVNNIRNNQFRGSTRRRRAQVRDEIADGEIDFMTHC